jgi:N-acetylmuramoyl-L-alanine amidase
VEHYHDKGMYKYTYGSTTDYNEILRLKHKVNEKFKDAFVVAFIKDERVETQKAIAMFKKKGN